MIEIPSNPLAAWQKIPVDPIEYIFTKVAVHSNALKMRPQCESCDFMQFEQFSPYAYYNVVIERECASCPKFEIKVDKDVNNKE